MHICNWFDFLSLFKHYITLFEDYFWVPTLMRCKSARSNNRERSGNLCKKDSIILSSVLVSISKSVSSGYYLDKIGEVQAKILQSLKRKFCCDATCHFDCLSKLELPQLEASFQLIMIGLWKGLHLAFWLSFKIYKGKWHFACCISKRLRDSEFEISVYLSKRQ